MILFAIPLYFTLIALGYVVLAGSYFKHKHLPFKKQCQNIYFKLYELLINAAIHILKQGPVPQHIAFIMDGNRRFARSKNLMPKEGHKSGLFNLGTVVALCSALKIKNVSLYAFAINNFMRPKDEVDAIMDLMMQRILSIDEWDLVLKEKPRIRYVGRLEMLSQSMRDAIEYAENMTRNNTGITLNVYCPYSSTDEMTRAVRLVAEKGEHSEFSEQKIEDCLMIPGPDLDILVRTSGETRFSNFMLWQLSKMAYIQFVEVNWPTLSLIHILGILFSWQMACSKIQKIKSKSKIPRLSTTSV